MLELQKFGDCSGESAGKLKCRCWPLRWQTVKLRQSGGSSKLQEAAQLKWMAACPEASRIASCHHRRYTRFHLDPAAADVPIHPSQSSSMNVACDYAFCALQHFLLKITGSSHGHGLAPTTRSICRGRTKVYSLLHPGRCTNAGFG